MRVNDTITAIEGNASPAAHEDVVDIIRAIGRPVVIGFQRSGGGGKEAKGAGSRAQEPGPFQRAQDAARRKMDEIKAPPQVRRRSEGTGRLGRCACGLTIALGSIDLDRPFRTARRWSWRRGGVCGGSF